MRRHITCILLGFAAAAACGRESWPEPPAIDEAAYRQQYDAWRGDRQESAEYAMRIVGIWPLPEGETVFGADPSVPIVLPGSSVPARAGAFRREGDRVTVVPAMAALTTDDGTPIAGPTAASSVVMGSLRLAIEEMGSESPKRLFVSAWDENHRAGRLPMVQTFPPDSRWRVSARFDAFDAPRPITVPDVRGGTMEFAAAGELVFQLDGSERRLTAIDGGGDQFFVMFKDDTNRSTTYGGYRILTPPAVRDGGWTVLDFNLAMNPPCAYSRFTTCPLPPRENTLRTAVEAGEKRYPSADGFSPAS